MEETIQAFDRVLSVAGISIYAKNNWDTKLLFTWQTFNFIISLFTFIFTTCFVIVNINDVNLCIQGACICFTGVIMFITFGVCLVFRTQFRKFLIEMAFKDTMLEMPLIEYVLKLEHGKLSELGVMVVSSQERLLKLTRVLLKTYVGSVWLCATLYLSDSVYQMVVREDDSLRLLGFDMWIPWSLQNFNVYLATFILNAYSGYLCCIGFQTLVLRLSSIHFAGPGISQTTSHIKLCCYHDMSYTATHLRLWFLIKMLLVLIIENVYAQLCNETYPGLQLTIILLVGQTIRQLRILTFILTNLDDLVLEMVGQRGEKWQTYCTTILTQCVNHYIKLKRFSNSLNVICRPFYLALILDAIMLVCVCSVKIAISNKTSPDTIKYYIHEFCFIMVVLLFCLLGQQVENESEHLEKAVTEKWYIFNRNHKTNVRIFKMALGQRMPIYIFGSIPLSAPTFTWFLKTGMSFFTLVMSVFDED